MRDVLAILSSIHFYVLAHATIEEGCVCTQYGKLHAMPIHAERVWRSLSRVHAVIESELERAVVTSGMSLPAYDLITEMVSSSSPLTMSELAERVVLSRTRVSRLVDELVREGLARREPNPDDGRSAFVEATKEGATRHATVTPRYRSALNSGLKAALTPEEFVQLAGTLDRMWPRQ